MRLPLSRVHYHLGRSSYDKNIAQGLVGKCVRVRVCVCVCTRVPTVVYVYARAHARTHRQKVLSQKQRCRSVLDSCPVSGSALPRGHGGQGQGSPTRLETQLGPWYQNTEDGALRLSGGPGSM